MTNEQGASPSLWRIELKNGTVYHIATNWGNPLDAIAQYKKDGEEFISALLVEKLVLCSEDNKPFATFNYIVIAIDQIASIAGMVQPVTGNPTECQPDDTHSAC